MGNAILDYIEKKYNKGKKLFEQRFHSEHCESLNLPDLDI